MGLSQKSKEIADLKQKLKRERLRNRSLLNAQRVRLDEDVVIDIGIDESKKEKKVKSSGRVVLGTVAAVAVCAFTKCNGLWIMYGCSSEVVLPSNNGLINLLLRAIFCCQLQCLLCLYISHIIFINQFNFISPFCFLFAKK